MKSKVNVGALTPPAPAPVAQTKTNIKYRPHIDSTINERVPSTLYRNVSRNHSKQLSNTDTSIRSTNKNRSDRNKLEKGRQKDKTKDMQEKEGDKSKANATVLSHRKIVLIIAYMRTGSTLTGSIFQEYPDTFYVFEPVRLINQAFKGKDQKDKTNVTLKYINGTKRQYKTSERNKVVLDEINSWLNCKLDSISTQSLTNVHHKTFTKIMKTFYFCSKKYISKSTKAGKASSASFKETNANLKHCLKKAEESCQKSPLVALKFIRLRMKDVAKLLPFYPNMKIIHLVRDPRGILISRIKLKAITTKNYQAKVKSHCSSIEQDLKFSKAILQTYSDRLKIVYYEDIAERPLETTRALTEFAGLRFVKSMQTFIEKQTHASRDSGPYATQRRNSKTTAKKWRTLIDPEMAKYTYNACKTSNFVLGYLPLLSVKALRNLTIPSRKLQDVVKNL
ncbi:carbohydrate sulfotransferase 3-like [Mercenaria mercenaria]|uniref:carbohydrate sulfotransferase 3-like n=1 Tax=Mercenaria mercenaria TaxID=6596 RepID=UPI00234EF667|nr:carbohydrate sulfotransferase 3-like [Mercenaria mercenaria]